MKLSKLYCSDVRFKNIKFNLDGLNVIYADVQSARSEKKNSHDLGKTKLAELIDFLFVKKITNSHFLLKAKDDHNSQLFRNFTFYLELVLNSGQFLTIKRSVNTSSKLSFTLQEQTTEGFKPPASWMHENIPFERSKELFSEFIHLDFFQGKSYDYRKAISYSLRMQGDYEDVYKLSKYVGGADTDWKPFMFDLLGFDGKLLEAKYSNDKEREEIKAFIQQIVSEYSVRKEDRDDIVAQLKQVEIRSSLIESQIDKFNFYEKDKELISRNIEEVESRISDLNTLSYSLNFEIDRLKKSIQNHFAFDLQKVDKTFTESKIYFPDQLKQDYNSLIEFNNLLTIERNKLLKQAISSKGKELKEINENLLSLNNQKEEFLSYLQDTDVFRRFKLYQKELVKEEGELLKLQEKLKVIDMILMKEQERETLLKKIEGTVNELKNVFAHTENNTRYSAIRNLFSKYYNEIMNEDARISWSINSNDNVDFIPPRIQTRGSQKRDTAKDEGRTYKKILCVSFDLAILSHYNNESYFRFVYHDDVLSQQDDGIKSRLLSLIRSVVKNYQLQYILSVIKSDLPTNSQDLPNYFPEEDVILKLHDRDESGTLFGFEF